MLIKIDLLQLLRKEKGVMQTMDIPDKYNYHQREVLKEQIIEDFKNNVLNQLRRVIAGSAKRPLMKNRFSDLKIWTPTICRSTGSAPNFITENNRRLREANV